MSKEDDINRLLTAFKPFEKRWDKLSPSEKVDSIGLVLEASRLSTERGLEIMRENHKIIDSLENQIETMDDILAFYEAFILEKGLTEEYQSYLDEVLSEFASAGKTNIN